MNFIPKKHFQRTLLAGAVMAGVAWLPLQSVAQSQSGGVYLSAELPVTAAVDISQNKVDIDFNVQADFAMVRISGPGFYAISKRVNDANFATVDLLGDLDISPYVDNEADKAAFEDLGYLPEGNYQLEVTVYGQSGEFHKTSRAFEVSNGTAVLKALGSEKLQFDEDLSSSRQPGVFWKMAGVLLDSFIPSAHAGTVVDDFVNVNDTAADNDVGINFDQSTAGNQTYSIRVENGNFRINRGTGTSSNSDVPFLNIVGGTGKVGLGTNAPATTLDLVTPNAFAGIRIEDTRNAWQISTGGFSEDLGFRIFDSSGSTTPFRIDTGAPTDSIRVSADGNVGIGIGEPTAQFHLNSGTEAANFLIQAGDGQQGGFSFLQGSSARWVFRSRSTSSNFEINRRNPDGSSNDIPLTVSYGTGNVVLQNQLEIRETAAPTPPPSGGKIFVDAADGDLKVRFGNGTVQVIATN